MEGYERQFRAPMYIEDINILTGESNLITFDRIGAGGAALYIFNPGNPHGNHKSPNAWDFMHNVRHDMEGQRVEVDVPSGKAYRIVSGNLAYNTEGPIFQDLRDTLYNQALSECMDRVRAPIDWSVNAGQASQVSSMVKKAINTVRYVKKFDLRSLEREWFAHSHNVRNLRKLHKGNTANELAAASKDVGGAWLEFQYGWKPLAQDLFNTAVQLGRDFPSLMTAVSRRGNQGRDRTVMNPSTNRTEVLTDYSQRVLMKMRFSPSAGTNQLLANFTSLNPASILWELTPFSFVADWFYDVGGYMRNLESSLLFGNSFRDGFWTYSEMTECHTSVDYSYESSPGYTRVTEHAKGSYRRTTMRRTPLGAMPFPASPQFVADLGSHRLLNAAALLSQHLKVR